MACIYGVSGIYRSAYLPENLTREKTMPLIVKAMPRGSIMLFPLARLYRIVKDRAQRNHNLRELKQLNRFMQKDIGLIG